MRKHQTIAQAVIIALSLGSASAMAATVYTPYKITTSPAYPVIAINDLNDSGEMVATSATYPSKALYWSAHNTAPVALPALPGPSFPAATSLTATGINNNSVVAGTYSTGGFNYNVATWRGVNHATVAKHPWGMPSNAGKINDNGVVTADYNNGHLIDIAVLDTNTNTATQTALRSGSAGEISFATDINNAGVMIAMSSRYLFSGIFDPASSQSYAKGAESTYDYWTRYNAINESGDVVGQNRRGYRNAHNTGYIKYEFNCIYENVSGSNIKHEFSGSQFVPNGLNAGDCNLYDTNDNKMAVGHVRYTIPFSGGKSANISILHDGNTGTQSKFLDKVQPTAQVSAASLDGLVLSHINNAGAIVGYTINSSNVRTLYYFEPSEQ